MCELCSTASLQSPPCSVLLVNKLFFENLKFVLEKVGDFFCAKNYERHCINTRWPSVMDDSSTFILKC